MHKEQRKHSERENRDRRNRDQDDRDPDTVNNGDISMHRLSDKRKSARKVEEFGGNSTLAPYDDKDALKSELLFTSMEISSSLGHKCLTFGTIFN